MERGFGKYPGIDPERDNGELEMSPELEPSEESLLEHFESGRRFEDEDEKARDYNAKLDAADEYQEEADAISEQISQATTQLAVLPLTPEQLQLMNKIEQLIVKRQRYDDKKEQAGIDQQIQQLTKQFAALPVTSEQADLLDGILEMIDAREATSVKLREIFNQK